MDEKRIEEELKKIWNETPVSHSEDIKEASWAKFQSEAFPMKKQKFKAWRYYASAAAILIFGLIGTGIYFNSSPLQDTIYVASNVVKNTTSKVKTVLLPDNSRVELSP
ncbi:MAG TPA: hypothetical protein VJ304_08290, partial [Flavobacterium sp.]|nr:hypothetical protein [Flavobacterium sp.]